MSFSTFLTASSGMRVANSTVWMSTTGMVSLPYGVMNSTFSSSSVIFRLLLSMNFISTAPGVLFASVGFLSTVPGPLAGWASADDARTRTASTPAPADRNHRAGIITLPHLSGRDQLPLPPRRRTRARPAGYTPPDRLLCCTMTTGGRLLQNVGARVGAATKTCRACRQAVRLGGGTASVRLGSPDLPLSAHRRGSHGA